MSIDSARLVGGFWYCYPAINYVCARGGCGLKGYTEVRQSLSEKNRVAHMRRLMVIAFGNSAQLRVTVVCFYVHNA